MKEFLSFLAHQIHHLIRYRQASQRWNDSSYEENLMLFDRYCLEKYPGDTALTQEMVDGWCRQRDRSANNSCRSRIYVVDSLVRFLNGRGYPLYSRDAYAAMVKDNSHTDNKELLIIPDTVHTDLYDGAEKMRFLLMCQSRQADHAGAIPLV